ncbi:MAG: zinc dependent phospholipase C family protein [Aggregatilineales bacterium]
MPTPFMHLAFAQRVSADDTLPSAARELLTAQWGAFLLGNVAPDARVSSGIRRADTHFFEYEPVIATPALSAMLSRFPELARASVQSEAQAAFLAGYGAHLAMDEVWCIEMLFPHFMRPWDDEFTSFRMLHMLLGYLDGRDYQSLPVAEQYLALSAATPDHWLPFIPDSALIEWRNVVADQIAPGGTSQTLNILSQRIKMTAEDMHSFIAVTDQMDQYLWRNVPPPVVETVEASMYTRARATLIEYLNG